MDKPFTFKITDRIPEAKDIIKDSCERNIRKATFSTHDVLIDQVLVGNRTGRTYNVPGTRKKYTASAPGEAPARRTGALATDYKPVVKGFEGAVGAMLLYSLMLEKGTKKMAPRPHLSTAFSLNRQEIIRLLSKDII